MALAAQGFTQPDRTRRITWSHMDRTIRQLNLLQIDSVNVLVRSHYLPLFSRLGNYASETLDERAFATTRKRALFECWAHEASLLPMDLHPLMRWRMARARAGNGIYSSMDRFGREEKSYLKDVLAFIRHNGPTTAGKVPGGGKAEGGWWGWSRGKMALETLFDQGLVTTATRNGFERLYDIPERVIPGEVLDRPTPGEADAIRDLLALSARAHGIGTEFDRVPERHHRVLWTNRRGTSMRHHLHHTIEPQLRRRRCRSLNRRRRQTMTTTRLTPGVR